MDIEQTEHPSLEEILEEVDVLYVTRIQRERFASEEVSFPKRRGAPLETLSSLCCH